MQEKPDALLLDLTLPGLSGTELLRRLRVAGEELPVLAVTADTSSRTLVQVLELGADDYIAKPFRGVELVARLRAVLRRAAPEQPAEDDAPPCTFGALQLDRARRAVRVDGAPVQVTQTEFRLLQALMERAGQPIASETLVRRIWGGGAHLDSSTLRVNVYRLRRKLNATGRAWGSIRSSSGAGWGLFEA
jgi:two-component system response regulator MprA